MLLALDTSGPDCAAALMCDDSVLIQRSDAIGRGHAEHLMGMLDAMFEEVGIGWIELTAISCTIGPGSFTGLRVGLATARGLSLALSCPCIGITVFEAFNHGETAPLAVVMDAKRDQVWMQVFGPEASDPKAVPIDQAPSAIPPSVTRLVGSAAPLLAQQDQRFEVVSNLAAPPIEAVARSAAQRLAESLDDLKKPKPFYLRAPDAKPQQSVVTG